MALRHRFSCVIKPSVPRPQTNRLRRRWIGKTAFLWGGISNAELCKHSQKFIHLRHKSGHQLGRILREFPPRAAAHLSAEREGRGLQRRRSSRAGGQRLAVENSGRTWYLKNMHWDHRHIVAILMVGLRPVPRRCGGAAERRSERGAALPGRCPPHPRISDP